MRLLLINPSRGKKYRSHSDFKIGSMLINKKYFALPLALQTLAGLTPPDVDVVILDEEIEPIDYDFEADLIGITAMTCKARRAYEIAEEFRKRGRHVVMGGIHASMLPEEALNHVDTVVVGEAEGIWAKVIEDFRNNNIQKLYRSDKLVDLDSTPIPRRELIKAEAYSFYMVQTTRGCPFECTFCSVQKFNGRKVRKMGTEKFRKEVEQIIEISKPNMPLRDETGKTYKGTINLFITDDNFSINKNHAIEICAVISELSEKHNIKIQWTTHADIGVAKDNKLLEIFSKSGCVRLFIGFESLDSENLNFVNKNAKNSDGYVDAIANIRSFGIDIVASFIIGNDFDDKSSVEKLARFIKDNNLYDALVSVLTPYPGTDLFFQLEKDNRLISKDWNCYDFGNVVYTPKKMTVSELAQIQNDLFSNVFNGSFLFSILVNREKGYLKNQSKLILEKAPNKYLLVFLIFLRASKILKDEGMKTREILAIFFYSLKFAFQTDKQVTIQTISGLIRFIDKIHYTHFCKKNYEMAQTKNMVLHENFLNA